MCEICFIGRDTADLSKLHGIGVGGTITSLAELQPRTQLSPNKLMTGSAAAFAVLGGGCLFFPQELVSAAGAGPITELPIQLFAGGLLAIAALNWMGRGAVYGGIYGRPIVVANFGFGVITAGTLTSALLDGRLGSLGWIAAAAFAGHALGFWLVMRQPPWLSESAGRSNQSERGSA